MIINKILDGLLSPGLAGKQAMKIDILEEAVKIAREKKWISHDGSSNKGGGK